MDRKFSTISVSLNVGGEPLLRFALETLAGPVPWETGGANAQQIFTGPLFA